MGSKMILEKINQTFVNFQGTSVFLGLSTRFIQFVEKQNLFSWSIINMIFLPFFVCFKNLEKRMILPQF